MKKILYAFLVLTFISCTNSNENKEDKTKNKITDLSKGKQVEKINEFNILDKPNFDLSKIKHDGKVVYKKFWQDSNGENIVLFTRNENELFAYHYAINSGIAKLLRRVYDFEKECDFDLTLEFIEKSIQVTDIDKNNFGEITFAYKKACISDVSPLDLKLIILENGNKFIIRGTTVVDTGKEKIGGDKTIDPSFESAPRSFLLHADQAWVSINK